MRRSTIFLTLVLLTVGLTVAQATPPDVLNYQGVLRDVSDAPLDGSYSKRTIQAAIDAIPLVLGGPVTVHVADGTYSETLLIWERVRRGGGSIRLEGNETSPQSVLLDGQDLLEQGMFIGDPGVQIALGCPARRRACGRALGRVR